MSLASVELRSGLLVRLHSFFQQRGFVEVETPLLADEVIPELHIEPVSVAVPAGASSASADRKLFWLQASPELHMKRLLAAGMQAIYQVTRSFRAGERGPLHSPEFTILEWYRVGDDLQRGMDLLDDLCQAVLEASPALRSSYADVFAEHVGLCPHTATTEHLAQRTQQLGIDVPAGMHVEERDEWLNLLLSLAVEPHLGRDAPQLLYDYPATQSALARIVRRRQGYDVAARFELYWRTVELANGYDELTDAAELRQRLETVNVQRQAEGRRALPLPESLLTAMDAGLPNCAGCALGFDRLVMLASGAESIQATRPIDFQA